MKRFPPLVARLIPSLGRENDHEIVAAARAIGRELAASSLDWYAIAALVIDAEVISPARRCRNEAQLAFGDLARACRDLDRGCLTPRERSFVEQMCRLGFGQTPSLRQREWLAAIFDRLQGRAAA